MKRPILACLIAALIPSYVCAESDVGTTKASAYVDFRIVIQSPESVIRMPVGQDDKEPGVVRIVDQNAEGKTRITVARL